MLISEDKLKLADEWWHIIGKAFQPTIPFNAFAGFPRPLITTNDCSFEIQNTLWPRNMTLINKH